MAHLPTHIQDRVTPFLIHCSDDYGDHKLSIFNCLEEFKRWRGGTGAEEDFEDGSIEIYNRYHYWFCSLDEFDNKFYVYLSEQIERFNKNNTDIVVHLSSETGGHKRVICASDSDNYGTFYFLITVTDSNLESFTYTLPQSLVDDYDDYLIINLYDTELMLEKRDENSYKIVKIYNNNGDNDDDGNQIILLSDEHYKIWDETHKYRWAITLIKKTKQTFETQKSNNSMKSHYENLIHEYEDLIEKYQSKYTVWPIYEDIDDNIDKLTKQLVTMELNSPEFLLVWEKIQAHRLHKIAC